LKGEEFAKKKTGKRLSKKGGKREKMKIFFGGSSARAGGKGGREVKGAEGAEKV